MISDLQVQNIQYQASIDQKTQERVPSYGYQKANTDSLLSVISQQPSLATSGAQIKDALAAAFGRSSGR